MDSMTVGLADTSVIPFIIQTIVVVGEEVTDVNFLDTNSIMISIIKGVLESEIMFRQIAADPLCLETASGTTNCVKCSPGYVISGPNCIVGAMTPNCVDDPCSFCIPGFFFNGAACVSCGVASCDRCSAVGVCTQCSGGLYA